MCIAMLVSLVSLVLYMTSSSIQCCNMFNDYCDTMEENLPVRTKREVTYSDTKGLADRVSKTLDELFGAGYNIQFRPGIGVHPTEVEVNIAIRSMGPVDETKEKFTLDCYFRQYWTDPRLSFNESVLDELAMNWQFLDKIWRPDTFFLNGKDSYLHKIAVPNRFIRIAPSGRISFSQRLICEKTFSTQPKWLVLGALSFFRVVAPL